MSVAWDAYVSFVPPDEAPPVPEDFAKNIVQDHRSQDPADAAHIVPVPAQGQHRVDNGLLLRADVHIMFDHGFLGVHPTDHSLQVSSRLRPAFGNGEEFYALAGQPIARPGRRADGPNAEFLEWHLDAVFRS